MNTKRITLPTLALAALLGGIAASGAQAQPLAYAPAGAMAADQQERADELY